MPIISCHGLAPAGNKGPWGHSVAPPVTGVGRKITRKRHISWVKDSLTDQRKWTVTTTILIRRIYKSNRMHRTSLSPPSAQCPVCSPVVINLPPGQLVHSAPNMMSHSIEYPVLFGHVGSAIPAVSRPGFLWKLTLSQPNPGHIAEQLVNYFALFIYEVHIVFVYTVFWQTQNHTYTEDGTFQS